MLPQNGVITLFEILHQDESRKLVSPRVVDDQKHLRVGFFAKIPPRSTWNNNLKMLKLAENKPIEGRIWTWSECVFMKRSLLTSLRGVNESREEERYSISQRGKRLFFWGPAEVIYLEDLLVNWREW